MQNELEMREGSNLKEEERGKGRKWKKRRKKQETKEYERREIKKES